MVRVVRRLVMLVAVTAVVVFGWAAPGLAHVEVAADKPQAGATDVTLTFTAESESSSAGIVSLQVVLPEGIAPADVSLVSGPSGWSLEPTNDGFRVGGTALAVRKDAEVRVRVAQLPSTSQTLTFKTLQTYSDGRVDRWIDIPTASVPNPDMPAPVLRVTGAVAAPTTTAPTTAAATTPPVIDTQVPPATAAPTSGSNLGWWIGLAALAALIVVVAVFALRRLWQRRGPTE